MGTQTKLGGSRAPRIRRRENSAAIARSRSQTAWLKTQRSRKAKAAMASGAATATKICQRAGGAVPVLRGMYAKRKAMAKQARNPSTCASGWKLERNPTDWKIGS